MKTKIWTVALLSLWCATAAIAQTPNQFWLAAQHDWGGKKGFFLSLNGTTSAGASTLADIKIDLGVGDGKDWHILSEPAKWEFGRHYTARVVITPSSAELWLDGRRLAREDVRMIASPQPLACNEQPSFLRGPSAYAVREESLTATGKGKPLEVSFDSTLPPALLLFNPAAGSGRRSFEPGETCTIDAVFTLNPAPDLKALAPFIDRFGQCIQADWPGKVRDESDLLAARKEEEKRFAEWGEPQGVDRFGGTTAAPWKQKPTGFYRVVQRDRVWWLVTPDGNPCFYVGLCDAPALDWEATPVSGREFFFQWLPQPAGEFARALVRNPWGGGQEPYFAPHTANLIRKYGPQWERSGVASALHRAKTLGFSGFGKWVSPGTNDIAGVAVLYHGEIPNLVRHPDVFDDRIQKRWAELLRGQIEPRKHDPFLIGWSVGNEHDENIAGGDIVQILGMPRDVPCKRALITHALMDLYGGDETKLRQAWGIPADAKELADATPHLPPRDVEWLRRFYADRYYDFIYKTIKSIDANHLYLGMWVTPNWWENDADWDLIAPHCDVIGYDFYATEFDAPPMKDLLAHFDKPVLCGEFSAPPDYGGARAYGRYHVCTADDNEAGQVYARYLKGASTNPKCVGAFYFQYRDQPITGRGPMAGEPALVIGENFAFGIVDVTDRLKWPMVERVRQANLAATTDRLRLQSVRQK